MKQETGIWIGSKRHRHRHHWSCIIAIAPSAKIGDSKPGQMGLKSLWPLSIQKCKSKMNPIRENRKCLNTEGGPLQLMALASDHQHANIATEAMDLLRSMKIDGIHGDDTHYRYLIYLTEKLEAHEFPNLTRPMICHWEHLLAAKNDLQPLHFILKNVRPWWHRWLCGPNKIASAGSPQLSRWLGQCIQNLNQDGVAQEVLAGEQPHFTFLPPKIQPIMEMMNQLPVPAESTVSVYTCLSCTGRMTLIQPWFAPSLASTLKRWLTFIVIANIM